MKVKFILALSLLINVVLVAWLVMTPHPRPARSLPVAGTEMKPNADPAASSALPPEAAPIPVHESFRWSQVDSGDDVAYIHNLRSIGCPADTIRDILTAAIGRRYDARRAELKERQKKGEIGLVAVQDSTARLWDEQNELISRLFGTPSTFGAGGTVAQASTEPSLNSGAQQADTDPLRKPIGLTSNPAPVVFLEPDPSWKLSDADKRAWEQVYDRFAAAVGGPGQDPRDPAYLERWRQAQGQADQQLKALFGANRVSQWQLQSHSHMPPASTK